MHSACRKYCIRLEKESYLANSSLIGSGMVFASLNESARVLPGERYLVFLFYRCILLVLLVLSACGPQERSSSANSNNGTTNGNSLSGTQTINEPLRVVDDCVLSNGKCPSLYIPAKLLSKTSTVTARINIVFDWRPWDEAGISHATEYPLNYMCRFEVCNSSNEQLCLNTQHLRSTSEEYPNSNVYWTPGEWSSTTLSTQGSNFVLTPKMAITANAHYRIFCNMHYMLTLYNLSRPTVLDFQFQ